MSVSEEIRQVVVFFGVPQKTFFNEEISEARYQRYFVPTAFAIILL
jgi:hypothetical protein